MIDLKQEPIADTLCVDFHRLSVNHTPDSSNGDLVLMQMLRALWIIIKYLQL